LRGDRYSLRIGLIVPPQREELHHHDER
jgi:hypothetical protein